MRDLSFSLLKRTILSKKKTKLFKKQKKANQEERTNLIKIRLSREIKANLAWTMRRRKK